MNKNVKTSFAALIFASFSTSLFTSCTQDNNPESLIVGTWNYVESSSTYISINRFTGEAVDTTTTSIVYNSSISITIIFREDNTFKQTIVEDEDTKIFTGTYSVSDNLLSLKFESGEGTDGHIKINIPKEKINYTIESIDRKNLVFAFSYTTWNDPYPKTDTTITYRLRKK